MVLSLLRIVWPFPSPLGLEDRYYGFCCLLCARLRVTPGRPAFWASPTHGYASQISPNKSVNFRCTSSPSTLGSVGNGFVVHRQLASESRLA